MSKETKWTPAGYEVTEDGRVFSLVSNWRGYGRREMRQHDRRGYKIVRLTVNGERKKYNVHRLVILAHVGPPPSEALQIRHLDGNPHNNHASNLAWGTVSENAQDRVAHGRQFYPPWSDQKFKSQMSAAMRRAHARKREQEIGQHGK